MIDGLHYQPDYIDAETEARLIKTIDAQIWQSPFKRRVQHYGYVYDYRLRTIDQSMRLGALPAWLQSLAEKLYQDGWIDNVPDQVIINEYDAGQGIALHVDCEPCFGDTIISMSLGSSCVMNFQHTESKETINQILEPCSLIVMTGTARYEWRHGIPARKTDKVEGRIIKRSRRISLTFRKVILDYSK